MEVSRDDLMKLISLYEGVIHGDKDMLGLFQCYDTYYVGCWDDELSEIESLKNKLLNGSKRTKTIGTGSL